MTISTDTAIRARRTAQQARNYLTSNPACGLSRHRAEQLIRDNEALVDQVDELNRLLFRLECELFYADEATTRERLL